MLVAMKLVHRFLSNTMLNWKHPQKYQCGKGNKGLTLGTGYSTENSVANILFKHICKKYIDVHNFEVSFILYTGKKCSCVVGTYTTVV